MRRFVVASLAVLLLSTAAQALDFGQAFPLTNTRYGTMPAEGRVVSNGTDVFLFWCSNRTMRAKLHESGVKRVGRAIMPCSDNALDAFDVVWTGSRFMVAATANGILITQMLDRDAQPVGGEFRIAANAHTPRLAANGTTTLLLFRWSDALAAIAFSALGEQTSSPRALSAYPTPSYAVTSNGTGFIALAARPRAMQMFLFDANGHLAVDRPLFENSTDVARFVSIASDGSNYLATWLADDSGGTAAAFDANGTFISSSSFATSDPGAARASASVWTGSEYVLAYSQKSGSHRLRMFTFDRGAQLLHEEPERLFDNSLGAASLVSFKHTTLLAWNPSPDSVVEPVPLGPTSLAAYSYGASIQRTLATTASRNATLVVWSEELGGRDIVRAGLRDRMGYWLESERIFADSLRNAVATSNGTTFLVVASDDATSQALRLDAKAEPIGSPITLPFLATSVAANNTCYAIAGYRRTANGGEVVASRMGFDGALTPPVVVRTLGELSFPAIASDGDQFLMVYNAATGLEATRLSNAVTRLDDINQTIVARDIVSKPAVAWNGTTFVVAWEDGTEVGLTTIAANGLLTDFVLQARDVPVHDVQLATLPNRAIAILWSEAQRHRVAVFNELATIEQYATIDDDGSSGVRIAALPSGRIAYVRSQPWIAPPYHGAPRVSMRVADRSLVRAPLPPTPIDLRVTSPQLSPAYSWKGELGEQYTGFRLEYRLSGVASWNDAGVWWNGNLRTALDYEPWTDPLTQFRIRAYTDWGISQVWTGERPVKRRSVR